MATISTDTYLDDGTARTAGETWTVNGCTLTIRTDTRVHAGAPASMQGSLGALTCDSALGGGLYLDGTSVRWLEFDTGTGVVAAIGTDLNDGGVFCNSSYLLGVWADYKSAPLAVGAAMPSNGYIKFREIDGTIPDNAVIADAGVTMSCRANGADRVGWIEVVFQQTRDLTFRRLGLGFKAEGDWFEIGTTIGTGGEQEFQFPTNGGGANTHIPGVQIETAAGSGVYDWYPALTAATGWSDANLSIDERSKYCQSAGNGVVRIGGDLSGYVGYTPLSACKVRIPNIIGRQCAVTGGQNHVNVAPHTTAGTRPEFVTTASATVNIDKFMCDWYTRFATPYAVSLQNFCFDSALTISSVPTPVVINDGCVGQLVALATIVANISGLVAGSTITKFKTPQYRSASGSYGQYYAALFGEEGNPIVISDCEAVIIEYLRNTSGYTFMVTGSAYVEFNDCRSGNSFFYCTSSDNIEINDLDHCDRLVGATTSQTGVSAIRVNACTNILCDGLTFGYGGTIADVHPYNAPWYATNNLGNIRFRNMGTRAAPLDVGSDSLLYPAYVFQDNGFNVGVKAQRGYLENTRSNIFLGINTSSGGRMENLMGSFANAQYLRTSDCPARGIIGTNSTTGQTSVYGSFWFDVFDAATTGRIVLACNEPTTATADYVTFVSGNPLFSATGNITMPTLGDSIEFEMDYYVLGHTGLANAAPTLSGTNTGNIDYEFQIDLNDGNGWSGTWETLDGTNLSAYTVSATDGFKLKYRLTTNTAAVDNAVTYVRIDTTSSAAAQAAALYPLDYAALTLTTYTTGTRIQVYDTDSSTELYNGVPAGATLELSIPYTTAINIRIRAMYQSGTTAKEFVEFTDTLTLAGLTRKIEQTNDDVYITNAINGSTVTGITIDDNNLLVEVDTGTISWAQIYAYESYWLTTEIGIRDEGRFIEAVDTANYRFFDFAIKNVTAPSVPLIISGGYGVDGDSGLAADIIDNTGGTIFCTPDHVVAYAAGSGGATAAEILDTAVSGHTTAGTVGDYLNRTKKYVANKAAISGTTYTIYEDDGTTPFQTGTIVTQSQRTPS